MKKTLLACTIPLLLSCPREQPPSSAPQGPPLDEALPAGKARCGLITRPTETIGGKGAYLEPGKAWRCYNHVARFGGGTQDGAVGLALWGGSLLDVDLVRDDETAAGEDLFRELFPAPGFRGVQVTSVEVLKSGEDGGDAVIRVKGTSGPLGILPQILLVETPFVGDVRTDFIMHPDVRHLEMTTTVFNNGARAISIMMGDFFAFGSGVRAFTPETGFGASLFSNVSAYAGASSRVSYAYTVKRGTFTIPVVDAGGTASIVRPEVTITDQDSFTRFLAVGDGDLASVLSEVRRIRGEPSGVLHLSLRRSGTPLQGLVSLISTATNKVVNQVRVRASGEVDAEVAPGTYNLKAGTEDAADVSIVGPVTVTAGETATAALTVPPLARAEFHVTENGSPIPAKLSVVPLEAPAVDEDIRPRTNRGLTTYAVSADGNLVASLSTGRYRFLVSRGPEYSLFTLEASLTAGQVLNQDVTLTRVVDTAGMLAAEFHQHSLGSLDSETDLLTKVVENAAEGVELAASTDHDNVTDYAPYVEAAGLTSFFTGWSGNEISYNGVGHFNAYPLVVDPAAPFRDVGARLWAGRSVVDLFAELRARPEDPVIHVCHPRSNNGKGYLAQIKWDPVGGVSLGMTGDILGLVPAGTYTTLAADFDALEVNGELADADLLEPAADMELQRRAEEDATSIPTMVDWLWMLNSNMHVTALGNSDSHDRNGGSGWPRNYLVGLEDRPGAYTDTEAREAIREQRVLVSNGLLVVPRVGTDVKLGKRSAVPVSGATQRITVTLESAAWLGGASGLQVILNGRPLHLVETAGVLTEAAGGMAHVPVEPGCGTERCRVEVQVDVPVVADSWVVFVARGSGQTGPVGQGGVYGYTNPVYLDRGGDGWAR